MTQLLDIPFHVPQCITALFTVTLLYYKHILLICSFRVNMPGITNEVISHDLGLCN